MKYAANNKNTALTLFTTRETSQAFRFISDKETHIQTTSQDFVRDKFYWFIERSLVLDIVGSCLAYGRGVILLVSYLLNWMHSWCVASVLKHWGILMHKDNIWGHFRAIKTNWIRQQQQNILFLFKTLSSKCF